MHATDADIGDNGRIIYQFSQHVTNNWGHLFRILGDSGDVIVNGELDFESQTVYSLTVTATDMGATPMFAYTNVVVTLTDVNDSPPSISVNPLTGSDVAHVVENSDPGMFVSHVSVSDLDQGIAGNTSCALEPQPGQPFALVSLGAAQYQVVTSVRFDYESQKEYNFTLTCRDMGSAPLSASVVVRVRVLDANDHAPEFHHSQYFATFEEGNDVNALVTQVSASDADEGVNSQITYTIRAAVEEFSQLLRIDATSGIIRTSGVFDFEAAPVYDYIITATDAGSSPLSSTAMLKLTLIDYNDEIPRFDEPDGGYTLTVLENQPVGTLVGRISATDADAYPFGEISFKIDPMGTRSDYFDVISQANGRGRVVTTRMLDREARATYTLWIVAHNQGYFNTENRVKVTINVGDVNDNDPVITFPSDGQQVVEVSNQFEENDVILYVNATDLDDAMNAHLMYQITSGNDRAFLAINSDTGAIYAQRALRGLKHEVFNLGIVVKDQGVPQRLSQADLTIVVDKNVAMGGSSDSGSSDDLVNQEVLMIIVGVVLSVLLLFVVIIVIVCCICYRQRRNDKAHKYNCRLEANKTLINSPASNRLAANSANSRQNSFTKDHIPESPASDPDYRSSDDTVDDGHGHALYVSSKEPGGRQLHSPATNHILMTELDCTKVRAV